MLDRSPSMADTHRTGSPETAGGQVPGDPSVAPIRNIADLAAMAGVAVSTVSRSLANKPGVKRETRDRIKQLAKMHNFCINTYAQSLRAGKGGERQAALPSPLNPSEPPPDAFTLRLLKAIFDQATRSGFDVRSRRLEAERIESISSGLSDFKEPNQSLSNRIIRGNRVTIQITIATGYLSQKEVGYCIELSAPLSLTNVGSQRVE